MATTCPRLKDFLETNGVPYEKLHHRLDFTAQEAAAHTHTPGREFAKTVILALDGTPAMAVLPAHHRVDTEKLRLAVKAGDVRILSEVETEALFPDCDVGAEPPFGNLYDLPVYLSTAMVDDEHITFNAGTHHDAVRMSFCDYQRLVSPLVVSFSVT